MNSSINMNKPAYTGYLLAFEPKRTVKIAEKLNGGQEVSESFSAMDWTFEHREVVFLSLSPKDPSIGAAVLMQHMYGNGGTGKLKMRMTHPVLIDDAITAKELADVVTLGDCISTAERPKRIATSVWPNLFDAIKLLRPQLAVQLDALLSGRVEERRLTGDSAHVLRLMEQRDAIGIVLEVASLDRQTILRNLKSDKVDNATSVLDLLDHEALQEQDVIRRDEQIFKELLTQDMRHGSFVGPSGRQVRVYVYDKKPLETVLGIDLLIYQESYKSFLLVQYKIMEPMRGCDGNTWSYLVDEQIRKQITAMEKGMVAIQRQPTSAAEMMDWRLNSGAFYFKFCETTRPNARDDALVGGITLGLEHLKSFLTLPGSAGDNGGQRIGYGNCPRYLNNTQFIELAREGWIGCDQKGYSLITDVLTANRDGGKVAMLAVIEGSGATTALERRKRCK